MIYNIADDYINLEKLSHIGIIDHDYFWVILDGISFTIRIPDASTEEIIKQRSKLIEAWKEFKLREESE